MPDHHHDPPTPPEGFRVQSALRLRLWIGGELRDELWVDADDPNTADLTNLTAAYHRRITDMADAAGITWMTEVYNPELPEAHAYLRVGTDKAGMVDPRRVVGWIDNLPTAEGSG